MNNKLTIGTKIEVRPNSIELVKSELAKFIAPTLQERGGIQYDLHQDNDTLRYFYSTRLWKTVNSRNRI